MKLNGLIKTGSIALNQKCGERADVFSLMAQLAKKSKDLDAVSETELIKAFEDREDLCSTSFADGIAIPHCHLESVTDFVIGIVSVPKGVDFSTPDNKPVKLFVFVVGPTEESPKYFKVLSTISEILRAPRILENILDEKDPSKVQNLFLKQTAGEIDTSDSTSKSYINVYVENEDLFKDILQILVAMEPKFLTVLEANSPNKYLAKLPLFAGNYNIAYKSLATKISAIMERKLVNETIRRIEKIVGNLDNQEEIILTVQEINYTVGNLEL